MRYLLPVLVVLVGCSGQPGISYSAFLNEISAGNVTSVEFSSGRADVELKDGTNYGVAGRQTLRVTLPQTQPQPQLIQLLEEHAVPFSVSE